MSEDGGAEAIWKWLRGSDGKKEEANKNTTISSSTTTNQVANSGNTTTNSLTNSSSWSRMTLGKGVRDSKIIIEQQENLKQSSSSIKWNHPWSNWRTTESNNPIDRTPSQLPNNNNNDDDSNNPSFLMKRMILGKNYQVAKPPSPEQDSSSVVPIKPLTGSLVPPRITQVTQELAVLAKEKSSEMVKMSSDAATKVIQDSTERATKLASTAVKTSTEVANKYVEQGKTVVTNVVKDSTNILSKYAQQTKDYGSQKIGTTVKKITEAPVHIATNIKLARDDLAMQSLKKAKQTRNFLVGMFIGGCFAFGLGIGLGAGGVRRHIE